MKLTLEQIALLESTDEQGVLFNTSLSNPAVIFQMVEAGLLIPCSHRDGMITAERFTNKGWKVCRKFGIKT